MSIEKDILIVEPFNGGSHGQLIKLLQSDDEIGHRSLLVSLPAKKWHWRARTSALYFSQAIPYSNRYRVVFTSSVLNLAELIALRPDLAQLKKVVYFHENQLVYPVRKMKERDFQYGYNQILTSLVADVVVFNSAFNMESFLSSISTHLKLMPDHRPKDLASAIRPKCRVLYFPVTIDQTSADDINTVDTINREFHSVVTANIDVRSIDTTNRDIHSVDSTNGDIHSVDPTNRDIHCVDTINNHSIDPTNRDIHFFETKNRDCHTFDTTDRHIHYVAISKDNEDIDKSPEKSTVSQADKIFSQVLQDCDKTSMISAHIHERLKHSNSFSNEQAHRPEDKTETDNNKTTANNCFVGNTNSNSFNNALSNSPQDKIEAYDETTARNYSVGTNTNPESSCVNDPHLHSSNRILEPFKGKETYLHIVWPHRWEHDKDPESFFKALLQLQTEGFDFVVSVIGETFTDVPEVFDLVKPQLADKILNWGYQTRQDYLRILNSADVVVSTALHEFFGVAVLEATGHGCYPLCPKRLVYPEIYPAECLYATQSQLVKRLKRFCQRPTLAKTDRFKVNPFVNYESALLQVLVEQFSWQNLQSEYRKLLLE